MKNYEPGACCSYNTAGEIGFVFNTQLYGWNRYTEKDWKILARTSPSYDHDEYAEYEDKGEDAEPTQPTRPPGHIDLDFLEPSYDFRPYAYTFHFDILKSKGKHSFKFVFGEGRIDMYPHDRKLPDPPSLDFVYDDSFIDPGFSLDLIHVILD